MLTKIYVGHMLPLIQNPRMLPLDLLYDYLIEYVSFELLYAIYRFCVGIVYRGVSGFATDCPCGVVFWLGHFLEIWLKMIAGL